MKTVDPVDLLLRACKAAGSQRRWALEHNVSPQYVTDILVGRREPGSLVLDALGLTRAVVYTRKERTQP